MTKREIKNLNKKNRNYNEPDINSFMITNK